MYRRAFDGGLLVRVTGDTIALSPPLIISEQQIDEIVEKLGNAIAQFFEGARMIEIQPEIGCLAARRRRSLLARRAARALPDSTQPRT